MKKLFIIMIAILALSGCDNLVDLSDQGTVSVKLSEGSSQRYIADGGATVDEAALGFVKEDVLYNFEFLEEISDFDGEYVFAGIPVGDYSFLAMLMSNEEIISMAVEAVTIEAGFNDIIVEMGPGMSLTINDKDIDIDELSEEFTIAFNQDVITIGVPAAELIPNFKLKIKTNAKTLKVFNFDGTAAFPTAYVPPVDELSFSSETIYFDATKIRSFQLRLTSQDDSLTSYKIKLIGN